MTEPMGFLRRSQPFSKLAGTVFEDMVARLKMHVLPAGTVLYRAGDPSLRAYFVYRGAVRLTHNGVQTRLDKVHLFDAESGKALK